MWNWSKLGANWKANRLQSRVKIGSKSGKAASFFFVNVIILSFVSKSITFPPHSCIVFENHSKCLIWVFQFRHFPLIFVLLRMTCLLTLFDRKLQIFRIFNKSTFLGIFNDLLSTQNANVIRFARKVEWYFFCNFQPPCHFLSYFPD